MNQEQPVGTRKELCDWYLARLRLEAALELAKNQLTPASMIETDRKMIQELVLSKAESLAARNEQLQESSRVKTAGLNIWPIAIATILFSLFASFDLESPITARVRTFLAVGCAVIVILIVFISLAERNIRNKKLEQEGKFRATLLSLLEKLDSELFLEHRNASVEDLSSLLGTNLSAVTESQFAIVDGAGDLVFAIDGQGRFTDVNAASDRILHRPPLSLVGANLSKITCEHDRERLENFLESCRSGSDKNQCEIQVNDGQGQPVDLLLNAEWSKTRSGFFCTARDISAKKRLDRLKAEITSMVSHDLRAPVSSFDFFLQGLIGGQFGQLNQKGQQTAAQLRRSLEQVLRLLNHLLDAERIEAGELTVDVKITPADVIAEDSVALLKPLAESKGIVIEFTSCELLCHADYDRAIQIMNNLLSNAIKWSPEGSVISITARALNRSVRFEVLDSGPGVPAGERETIFERYKIAGTRQNETGAGLGLFISSRLVRLQNGSIGVSDGANGGSCFWFSLPQANEEDLPDYSESN